MLMQKVFRKFVPPLAAAVVFAVTGTAAHAVTPPEQTPEKPVDCKKKPDHPRCKDKRN